VPEGPGLGVEIDEKSYSITMMFISLENTMKLDQVLGGEIGARLPWLQHYQGLNRNYVNSIL
jgi:hypothetical protein